MPASIYEYDTYKDYLLTKVKNNANIRGYQTRLAEAARCQKAYVTQVLYHDAHFTMDQALGVARFWDLPEDERDFFLLLLQKEKAATPELAHLSKEKIEKLRAKHLDLGDRLKGDPISQFDKAAVYYGNWINSAVHVLTSIPEYGFAEKIAARLDISPTLAQSILKELEKIAVVEREKGRWKPASGPIHASLNSPFHVSHLLNWRIKAVEDLNRKSKDSIHFTALHTLSKSDARKVSNLILQLLDETKAIVGPSKEEEMVCVNIDYFVI